MSWEEAKVFQSKPTQLSQTAVESFFHKREKEKGFPRRLENQSYQDRWQRIQGKGWEDKRGGRQLQDEHRATRTKHPISNSKWQLVDSKPETFHGALGQEQAADRIKFCMKGIIRKVSSISYCTPTLILDCLFLEAPLEKMTTRSLQLTCRLG